MNIQDLKIKPSAKSRNKKRIGRGGKRGTTSGRGQKGQKSRSGHRLPKAARHLILRLPKFRGYKNKPKSPKPFILNIKDLKIFKGETVLNKKTLKSAGLVPKNYNGEIKILSVGEIDFPVKIEGLKLSKAEAKLRAKNNLWNVS